MAGKIIALMVVALLLRPSGDDGCAAYCSECVADCVEGCEQRCHGVCSEPCARTCERSCRRCVDFCRAWLRPQRGEPAERVRSPRRRGGDHR